MTHDPFIGDRAFSSWSLPGWLMLEKFGLPHRTHLAGLCSGTLQADLAELAPARLVPVMRDADGIVIGDSLAMAETLADPAFRKWRALGPTPRHDPMPYDTGLPTAPWPGPAPRRARAVAAGRPENAACPYSGRPVTHLLDCEGRIFGFCNAACRDKTVIDPDAWPAFSALRLARTTRDAAPRREI